MGSWEEYRNGSFQVLCLIEFNPQYREPGLSLGDVVADRYDSRDQDDYTQAGNLWRIFSEDEKNRTAQAIARSAVPLGQSQER